MANFSRFALAAALMVAVSPLAYAQNAAVDAAAAAPAAAKAKVKAKAKAKTPPKNASEVIISNARTVDVLSATVANGDGKVFVKLKKPLGAGKKLTVKLPAKAGCLFIVNASFADQADFDQADVNLCLDKVVKFTD